MWGVLSYKGLICGLICVGLGFMASFGVAGTLGGKYDMSIFIKEPHPFDQSQSVSLRSIPVSSFGSSRHQKTFPVYKIVSTHKKDTLGNNNPQSFPTYKIVKSYPKTFGKIARNGDNSSSAISEIRIGALAHDIGPFSSHKEDGYDGNLELLLVSPKFLRSIGEPRPHIGTSVNTNGNTNQVYFGLTWELEFNENFFTNFSIGGVYHDGYRDNNKALGANNLNDNKSLGCDVLFRESVDFGYRLNSAHSIMAYLDHSSNASLCSTNEGLESVGIRYGYLF